MPLEEQIRLVVTAPPIQGGGLKAALGYLRALDGYVSRIGRSMAGIAQPPDLEAIRRKVQMLGKDLKVLDVANLFGVDDARQIDRAISRMERSLASGGKRLSQAIKGYQQGGLHQGRQQAPQGTFIGPKWAAEFARQLEAEKAREQGRAWQAFRQMMAGGGGPAPDPAAVPRAPTLGGAAAAAGLQSPVVLKIRGDQVVAQLVTPPPVTLAVPGSALAGAAGGGPGGGGGGGGKAGKGGAAAGPLPGGPNVIRTATRTTGDGDVYQSVTQALSPFRTLTTRQTPGGLVSTEMEARARAVRDRLNQILREQAEFQAGLQQRLRGRRNRAMVASERGAAARASATRLENLLAGDLGGALEETGQGPLLRQALQRVERLRAVGTGQAALADREQAARDNRARQLRRQRTEARSARTADAAAQAEAQRYDDELARLKKRQYAEERQRRAEAAEEARREREWQRQLREQRQENARVPPRLRRQPRPRVSQPGGLAGLGALWMHSAAKVARWSTAAIPSYAAIGAAYGVIPDAFGRVVERSYQTARLSQVFRGDGGQVRELAKDVLALAAAEGQAADQAMESAISWSRLGLTRRQVAEAVRVSLQAANVAELESLEATKQLQAVMMAYGMRVDELAGFLGKLNSISNTLNVTNADLLAGISKSASVAQQMGMPVEMLAGMIGAGAASGQTGAQMGNALKTFMVRLMDPTRQTALQERLGIETRTSTGIKPANEIFAEMAQRWQSMSGQERGQLQQIVAGATQGNRLAILMDSFATASVQAINALQNLNSAEKEDAKIKAEAKSRLAGMGAAWDRMLYQFDGATSASQILGEALSGLGVAFRTLGQAAENLGAVVPGGRDGVRLGMRMMNPLALLNYANERLRLARGLGSGRITAEQYQQDVAALNRGGAPIGSSISRLEILRSRATSFGMAAALLRGSGSAGAPSGAALERTLSALGGLPEELIGNRGLFQEKLRVAAANGTWDKVLGPYAERASALRDTAHGEATQFAQERLAYIQSRLGSYRPGPARAALEDELRAIQGERGRLRQEDAEVEEYDAAQASDALARQAMVLERIQAMHQAIQVASGDRLEVERRLTEEQIRYLEALQRTQGLTTAQQTQIRGKLVDLGGRLGALGSPEVEGLDALARARTLAAEVARAQAEEQVAGANEIQRLQSRESILQRLIGQKRQLVLTATDELARTNAQAELDQHRLDLEENRLALVRQRAQAAREEQDYNRAALTADPAALVRRAYAARLGRVEAGRFFTLSPEMRQAVLEEQDSLTRRAFLRQPLEAQGLQDQVMGRRALELAAGAAALAATHLGAMGETTRVANAHLTLFHQQLAQIAPVLAALTGRTPLTSGPPPVAQAATP